MRVNIEYGKDTGDSKYESFTDTHLYKEYDFVEGLQKTLLISGEIIKQVVEKNEEGLKQIPKWRQQIRFLKEFLETAKDNITVLTGATSWNFIIHVDGYIELGGDMIKLWLNQQAVIEYLDKLLRKTSINRLTFLFDAE